MHKGTLYEPPRCMGDFRDRKYRERTDIKLRDEIYD